METLPAGLVLSANELDRVEAVAVFNKVETVALGCMLLLLASVLPEETLVIISENVLKGEVVEMAEMELTDVTGTVLLLGLANELLSLTEIPELDIDCGLVAVTDIVV